MPLHAPLKPRADGRADARRRARPISTAATCAASRAGTPRGEQFAKAYKNDLGLERQFVAAGGLLLAGPDPTGNGGVIPGFGDQRELELLVEAGFTPVEAIRIAHAERRDLSRPRRPHRLDRAGQERRPVDREGQSRREHRRRREGRYRLQGRRRLRQRQAARQSVKGRYGQY